MKSELFTITQKVINELVYPFYELERDMELPLVRRNENDAEHSWSLALIACALAPKINPKLDVGKIAQFSTVHDLVEVYSGDVSIYDADEAQHANKEENERKAMEKIREEYASLPWIAETLDEYERKDTEEARYVWAMDKYAAMQMRLMYAQPFFHRKGITREFFDTSMQRMRHKVEAYPKVAELFDELMAEFDKHPEWFVVK